MWRIYEHRADCTLSLSIQNGVRPFCRLTPHFLTSFSYFPQFFLTFSYFFVNTYLYFPQLISSHFFSSFSQTFFIFPLRLVYSYLFFILRVINSPQISHISFFSPDPDPRIRHFLQLWPFGDISSWKYGKRRIFHWYSLACRKPQRWELEYKAGNTLTKYKDTNLSLSQITHSPSTKKRTWVWAR